MIDRTLFKVGLDFSNFVDWHFLEQNGLLETIVLGLLLYQLVFVIHFGAFAVLISLEHVQFRSQLIILC